VASRSLRAIKIASSASCRRISRLFAQTVRPRWWNDEQALEKRPFFAVAPAADGERTSTGTAARESGQKILGFESADRRPQSCPLFALR
jgi:hypothetical protein